MNCALQKNKKVGIKVGSRGLGDTIASIPTIRKISKVYDNLPLTVFSHHPELFNDHPLISESLPMSYPEKNYEIHNTFNHIAGVDHTLNNITTSFRHQNMDIRQFHAVSLGFALTQEEMEMDLYIEDKINLDFSDYVLIHPTTTWGSRTWDLNKWQKLINLLNNDNIPVIAIGKNTVEHGYGTTVKEALPIKIELGQNLMNNPIVGLSHIRWMMNNQAKLLITMDTGILHLAGTTDVRILQLGSSIHYKYRAPYRKGTQEYKYKFIGGSCKEFCASNMKYNIKIHNSIQSNPPLAKCLDNRPTFECHPNVEDVYKIIKQQFNEK
jgi:ADP-heptose:LPS heptosyltransferase